MGAVAIELYHLINGYEAVRKWGADIVHDHTLAGPVYAQRFPDLAVVTTNHGPFNNELVALYGAIADKVPIIAISHDQARRAEAIPIAGVIHHGLEVELFPFGDGQGDERGPYFIFLGRMAPEKGARSAALAAREAGVRLLIAAKMQEPLEIQFFEEKVQPLLDDQVEFIGEVGTDKLALLGGATALLNPIRWPEPFGLVMIEALACGTPVVTFKEGSAPELIDDGVTGYLCDELDDLVDRIGDVKALDRHACRAAAEERFSMRRMVQEHLDLFERIIAQHPRTGG
jgi:glycosyltransferase involved in cell wall biosynthesis